MLQWITIYLGGGSQQQTGPYPLREPQHVNGTHHRCFDRLHGVMLVVNWRGRTGEMINLVYLQENRLDDVMAKKLKAGIRQQMGDVTL
jgi:hypothetical protein